VALKKSALYSSLWESCDELRGGMDASQYKDYVLVLLFVKYVSDKYANDPDAEIDVPPGGSFADMVALKNDKEIGDKINKIIGKLVSANESLKGSIELANFNDEDKLGKGKEMVDRLTKLVAIFEGLDFGRNRADGDDLLGDAYEYLIQHFAVDSGKSKGQFYTPAEVSRVISMVIELGKASSGTQTIYDPTCGSGSLLIKAHDEAMGRTGHDLTLYGQEMDTPTAGLARMNMVLHGCPTAEIWSANSLAAPYFKNAYGGLKTFDYVVANPPFSNKNWTSGLDPANDLYNRFAYGIPPDKNGDYAFLLHILTSLNSTGKGAVILPHGVLFRGNAESDIRKSVVTQGYIKGIIGLPPNLFFGTGIPACIIVMDKEGAAGRKGIFMVDASKGYRKDGNKNRLRAQDIHKIVDTFTRWVETPKYSRIVPLAEIEANDYNLNLPRYIDSTEAEDWQSIESHLLGGIPHRDIDGLAAYWTVFPNLRKALFADTTRPGHSQLKLDISQIKSAIFSHPEFTGFNASMTERFANWKQANTPKLNGIQKGDRPKALIDELSESLLETFKSAPLLDTYDLYQHLMDYWAETLQDDVYMLASDGWEAAKTLRQLVPQQKNGKDLYRETHDFLIDKKRLKADIIPPTLIIGRYYPTEQAALEQLEADTAALGQQLEDMREEHGGEEGLLSEVMEDGKISKSAVTDRLKTIRYNPQADDERKALESYLDLIEQEAAANRKAKDAKKALDAKVAALYGKLTEADSKTLVVEDKWLTALSAAVQGELERVSQTLTGRIKQLAERYAAPLPQLLDELEALSSCVDEHLKSMGIANN
jgi:type I restriction enzyme M protein